MQPHPSCTRKRRSIKRDLCEMAGRNNEKGRATLLRYRRPLLSFVPTVIIFGIFTYYCITGVVDPNDVTRLLPPPTVREILAARASNGAGHDSHKFQWELLLYYVSNKFYSVGLSLLGSLFVQQTICGAAWLAHVGEALYAWSTCRKCAASSSVTMRYVVGTFLGGVTQLLVLKKEVSRL